MILTCCAADGRPVKIAMKNAVELPDDTWVEVTGSYVDSTVADGVNGEKIPFLDVESMVEVSQPERPYE
ncbi:hypothetical protein [Lentzea aerocolonigenes]|uniref:TIGR03943 family putative permease subunit n=1 Tax=Lentzea aerocolonigenes TaxID=68170 RepID=UPI000A83C1B4|nr:hypothetical protein [Lentzea aerocolonigenes]